MRAVGLCGAEIFAGAAGAIGCEVKMLLRMEFDGGDVEWFNRKTWLSKHISSRLIYPMNYYNHPNK